MGAGASSAATDALKAASETEVKDAIQTLNATEKARLNLALAWSDLMDTFKLDPFLVEEVEAMQKPPAVFASVEQALCKLCSLDPVGGDENPDWHTTAQITLYGINDPEHPIVAEVAEAKQKRFLNALSEVQSKEDVSEVAAKLADFVKDPNGAPDEAAKASMLMGKVSAWLHALCGKDGKEAREKSWAELTSTLAENKFLVDEMEEMNTVPEKISLVEEAMLKACSLEENAIECDGKKDWHTSAQIFLYRLEDEELLKKRAQCKQDKFCAELGKIKSDKAVVDKLATFVKDPACQPDKLAAISLLMQKVSAWLHALHQHGVSL
eukprot:TRINITY_DN39888_c0_g1_i1.p1 TRINITY_DN39888_c0_g1~~TRINITY_DN39888_c0_g1_i1.p1  ORF type:complete len:347 (-),score=100.29 TRINITY_DN39888_c0_g1_i1:144-1115(-)